MTTIDQDLLPEPLPPERRGWRTADLARAAVVALAVWFGLRMLWSVSSLVFLVFLASLFGLAVGRGVDYAERFKIRRGLASALIVFGTLGLIGGGFALSAPTLIESGKELQTEFPAALTKLQNWVDSKGSGMWGSIIKQAAKPAPTPAVTAVPTAEGGTAVIVSAPVPIAPAQPAGPVPPGAEDSRERNAERGTNAPTIADPAAARPSEQLKTRIMEQLQKASRYLFSAVSSTVSVVAAFVLLVFLAIYIGAEPDVYRGWMLATIPATARPQMRLVLEEMAKVLRKWLVTQLIAMVAIGVITTIVLLLLGVKAPYALGFIAGLLEFIPTVGPIMAAVPAIIMGFTDSPQLALYVGIAYWGIQFIENNLLIPYLMRGGMDLPPAITLVAQGLMTLLFGFIGLMVAVPLTAAVLVPLRMVAEKENARERAIVKFTRLQQETVDAKEPAKVTVGRADRGPLREPSKGASKGASTDTPKDTPKDASSASKDAAKSTAGDASKDATAAQPGVAATVVEEKVVVTDVMVIAGTAPDAETT